MDGTPSPGTDELGEPGPPTGGHDQDDERCAAEVDDTDVAPES